jgi:hypothetical protein
MYLCKASRDHLRKLIVFSAFQEQASGWLLVVGWLRMGIWRPGNILTASGAPGFFQSQQSLHHWSNWPPDHLVLIIAAQASLCEGNSPSFRSLK